MEVGVNPNSVGDWVPSSGPVVLRFTTIDHTPPLTPSVTIRVNITNPDPPVIRSVVNAASLARVVTPGAVVLVQGVNLGPNMSATLDQTGPGQEIPTFVSFVTVDQDPPARTGIFVTVTYVRPPSPGVRAVVSAASLEPAVTPGALVSMVGSSLAPTLSASYDSGGLFPTSLGGTSVTFKGIPAPLISTSAGRINAVAPYQLAGQKVAEESSGIVRDRQRRRRRPILRARDRHFARDLYIGAKRERTAGHSRLWR